MEVKQQHVGHESQNKPDSRFHYTLKSWCHLNSIPYLLPAKSGEAWLN
jgi:hypothetical protein